MNNLKTIFACVGGVVAILFFLFTHFPPERVLSILAALVLAGVIVAAWLSGGESRTG